uniref:Uncharacterized protein n=1 Tax=viral metagenome TaxID=1070528 RepID=A0A6M3KZF8_9ZZZZ
MAWNFDPQEVMDNGIFRGVEANNPEYPRGHAWDLVNMRYDRNSGDPEKLRGYLLLGSSIGSAISGLFDMDEGTRLIACAEDGKIYHRTTGSWAACTGGTGFSTTSGVRWSGGMFYGATTGARLLVISNGIDVPKKVTTAGVVSTLGGSPPAAGQFGCAWAGRWWLASGDTVYGSKVNDCEEWATTALNVQIVSEDGNITGMKPFGDSLLIFKRATTFRLGMSDASRSALSSTYVHRVATTGTPSHWSVAEAAGGSESGVLFVATEQGLRQFVPTSASGGFYVRAVADNVDAFTSRWDLEYGKNAFGLYNEATREYWFQYPLSSAVCNDGVIGNISRSQGKPRWSRHTIQNLTAGCFYRLSGAAVPILGDSAGNVFQAEYGDARNGSAFTGRIVTPSYTQGFRARMKNYGCIYMDISTQTNDPVNIYASLGRSGFTSPYGNDISLDALGNVGGWGVGTWGSAQWGGSAALGKWVRLKDVTRGTHLRLVIQTPGATQWFKLNGMTIQYEFSSPVLVP